MDAEDEVYGEERALALREMLRALAARILLLDQTDALLEAPADLLQQLGTIRSELFHYEVRCTYDTPEIAEHRKLVRDADDGWSPDDDPTEDGEPWQLQDPN